MRRAGFPFLVGVLAAAGCSSPPSARSDATAITDPCQDRLHDLEGPLLEYYVIHGRLPGRLEELRELRDLDQELVLVCPVSGRPYLYDRQGIRVPKRPGTVVVWDPLPSHAGGVRWAISIVGGTGANLDMRVIALMEDPARAAGETGAPGAAAHP